MISYHSVADPKIWNRGGGRLRGAVWGEGIPYPKNFGKFYAKIMPFSAKYLLLFRCIRSIGGGRRPLLNPPLLSLYQKQIAQSYTNKCKAFTKAATLQINLINVQNISLYTC